MDRDDNGVSRGTRDILHACRLLPLSMQAASEAAGRFRGSMLGKYAAGSGIQPVVGSQSTLQ
jgi:hypothetical protein